MSSNSHSDWVQIVLNFNVHWNTGVSMRPQLAEVETVAHSRREVGHMFNGKELLGFSGRFFC
jgi:hypothetical protein